MPLNENGPFPLPRQDLDEGSHCRFCSASLIDEKGHRREIGVEGSDYDGVLYFYSPVCQRAWSAWTGDGSLTASAVRVVIAWNEALDNHRPIAVADIVSAASRIDAAFAAAAITPRGWRYNPAGRSVSIYAEANGRWDERWDRLSAALTGISETRVDLHYLRTEDAYPPMTEYVLSMSKPRPPTGMRSDD